MCLVHCSSTNLQLTTYVCLKSVDPVRKTAQLTTEKRPRGRPRKEDAVDDVVPAKRSKLSNSCNVREPEPSARSVLD